MDITVILCTYNRCESLARALESVAAQRMPESTIWEVLVVDNNSGDRTPEVVEQACQQYPGRFCYTFEPKPGKSNALNTGIAQTSSDILAFMDDDVVVQPDWLQNLTSGLGDAKWAGAGGRILPAWTSAPPAWLPRRDRYALAPLAAFDPRLEAGDLDEPPFGTNMAFRRSMFTKYGGFRTDLGPRPNSEIRNEDTEFGQRLLNAGERLKYEPLAVVYHSVSPQRLQRSYFMRWWLDKGRADFREHGFPNAKWSVFGIPLAELRRLTMAALRWIPTIEPSLRFERKLKLCGKFGEILECRRSPGGHDLQTLRE
ncbi:MAG TPA: glycosyltransferase family 2 protein [Silvibacterium sp.]|nr:glycosyltransferase family 2 protein [Silvibacterium sp.]